MSDGSSPRVLRRPKVLRMTVPFILIAMISVLLAACGSSKSGSGNSVGTPKPGATINWGIDMAGATFGHTHLDPTQTSTLGGDFYWQLAIYDSFLHINPDGTYAPGLALSATVVDPQTIDVVLRPGLHFSDGTSLDATAAKAAILHNEQAKTSTNQTPFLPVFFNLSGIDVTSPTKLTLHLSKPSAGAFYPLLAENPFFLISPTAAANPSNDLDQNPVGAGPFKVTSYTPDQSIDLVKNPHYWNAKNVSLGRINILNIPSGPQQVTALESGQIDLESAVSANQVATLKQAGMQTSVNKRNNSAARVIICKSSAPFDNVSVRQALAYATDRQAINDSVEAGLGEPQWGVFPSGDQYHLASLVNNYRFDPNKAKSLLASAGYPNGFSTSITIVPGNASIAQMAQILQAQWAQVGIRLQLVTTTNYIQTYTIGHQTPLAITATGQPDINVVAGPFTPGTLGDQCNYSNDQLNNWVAQLKAGGLSPTQTKQTWTNIQQFVTQNVLADFIVFVPLVTAWNKHVSGVQMLQTFYGFTPQTGELSKTS